MSIQENPSADLGAKTIASAFVEPCHRLYSKLGCGLYYKLF
jgi:hypothetical protein